VVSANDEIKVLEAHFQNWTAFKTGYVFPLGFFKNWETKNSKLGNFSLIPGKYCSVSFDYRIGDMQDSIPMSTGNAEGEHRITGTRGRILWNRGRLIKPTIPYTLEFLFLQNYEY